MIIEGDFLEEVPLRPPKNFYEKAPQILAGQRIAKTACIASRFCVERLIHYRRDGDFGVVVIYATIIANNLPQLVGFNRAPRSVR